MTAIATHAGRYSVLSAELSANGELAIGIVLQDPATDGFYVRLRRDWEEICDAEEFEVLSPLEDDLRTKARQMGAGALMSWFEENASASIRTTDREEVLVDDFERTLNRLYTRHVQTQVVPFRTHLPRYSLQVAAGRFLENEEVTEQGWEEMPPDLRLTEDMFVARIAGRSMEPYIPDGALCVFRAGVTGSRQGRLVLVEHLDMTGNNRYTVKRYRSEKAQGETWRHERIRLESLNPDYPSWDLNEDPDKYRVLAEFVRVLE